MKITIEVPDMYIEVLKNWPSVSRTFDAAIKAIEDPIDLEEESWTIHELTTLRCPLDVLNKAFQEGLKKKHHED